MFRRTSTLARTALLAAAVVITPVTALGAAAAPQQGAAADRAPAAAAGTRTTQDPKEPGDPNTSETAHDVVFAIHGGAGTLRREDMTPELEREYRAKLTEAVRTGQRALADGESSVAAVEAAINVLEDSPLFNAGKGAVFTTDAENELDAALMDGATLDTGAVTGVTHIKNPISLAREMMENSRHVLMSGEGAERFAQHRGMELVTQDYFFTERRWESLMAAKKGESDFDFGETGTVGAVGIDGNGDLAAGTSTGGLTNKPVGRVGDTPIVGAGTYAKNGNIAASATGTGELFIREAVTHTISAQVEYLGRSVSKAAGEAIDRTEVLGGDDTGGVIALDSRKNLAFTFNTSGMYRGYATADGEIVVKIFADE
ncbi:isoaspartyl peptidase/L-asparaginase [Streptomyces sp. NBC_01808]|uniref:isoaspartyl peptidase/L-asparaginase family protein n=1 Tax=Streptomyces sp. NBC_01808 TaxID=2975947 RepID=UPI002DD9E3BA|nr:isoaspartyl peptidase/L-asparaginase [Streptomyces sp. NBC_01808]WSA41879.1 isoaspartyl peptidase/L-asparaginase [Streptomyces sp. NBC_01808]